MLYFFSNEFIFNEVARTWEVPAIATKHLPKHKVGVVLGGILTYDRPLERMQFLRANDRLLQAVLLYKERKIDKLLFVGGSGSITFAEDKEGPFVATFLNQLGIPNEDVWIEGESKNTYENAKFATQILKDKGVTDSLLLITSAFHMRRSLACFKKQGLHLTPFSTDRYSGCTRYQPDYLLAPTPNVLSNWSWLFHEWLGMVTYKLAGYI